MIKVGIMGFGKMGKIRAEAVKNNGNGKVMYIYDPDLSLDINNYNIARAESEIINDPGIDAVFICTPNYLNKQLTIQSLKAGKHVFCEKPPAFTADDVEEIREIESASGKKLMYGFNHRHHASIAYMKELIESQKCGKILWMRGRYGKSVDDNFYNNWRSKKELAGGGILIDQGIHMLDLFSYLGGSFDEVKAYVSNLYWNVGVEDNVFAMYKNNKTGVIASLHSTMTQWRHLFSLEIFLENGYLVLNGLKTPSGTYGDEVLCIARNRSTAPAARWEDEEHITFHTDKSWESEVEHFFGAIIKNKTVELGNSDDALELMKLIDQTYKSI